MFGSIYNILDHILPSSDKSNLEITRLEYMSACKIMENEKDLLKSLPHMPASMFDLLLQSVINKCYMEFINIDYSKIKYNELDMPLTFPEHLQEQREIAFPDTLCILIFNWPKQELVLKNQIPSFYPPFEMFENIYGRLISQQHAIGNYCDMLDVFHTFCHRLIQFIINAVFKCTAKNANVFSCSLKRLDVSGLGSLCSPESHLRCFSRAKDILEGIRKSTIDTFGHKIEIIADANVSLVSHKGFETLKNIIKENLNPEFGISLYFNKIETSIHCHDDTPFPSDFINDLALKKCKYINLSSVDIDVNVINNVFVQLPELIGISLDHANSIENLDFLSGHVYLEYLSLSCTEYNGVIDCISNMSKGLKYLNLTLCSLCSSDLECLAKSIHSDTLLELDLNMNWIQNDYEAVGLITLCQNMRNIKVLTVDDCCLELMSSNSVSKLAKALKDCVKLEFLSIRANPFSLDITNMIIDELAQNKALRYLSLNFPGDHYDLCKTFHETINRYRYSPIYISWC